MGRRAVGARPEAQGRILNRSGLERGRGDRKEKVFSAEFTCKTETAYRAKAAGPSPGTRGPAPIWSRKSAQMSRPETRACPRVGQGGKGLSGGRRRGCRWQTGLGRTGVSAHGVSVQ